MSQPDDPLLSVQTKACGEVVLWPAAWENHIVPEHPEMAPYLDCVRATLEDPNLVYETPSKKPTLAFYRLNLITDDPYFRACYVAVFVRYKADPPCVCTAYLAARLSANPGRLIHGSR